MGRNKSDKSQRAKQEQKDKLAVADRRAKCGLPPEGKETAWVGRIEHRHGTDTFASKTRAGLYGKLREYVDSWWDSEIPHDPMPKGTDEEVVEAYFTLCEHEGYEADEVEL